MRTNGQQSARELLHTAQRMLEDEHAFAAAAMVEGAIDCLEHGTFPSIAARSPARRFGHALRATSYRSCA
jgi:hypothetical protein